MLPKNIKNEIIEVKNLFNNFTYMREDKNGLENLKNKIIKLIKKLKSYRIDSIHELAKKYQVHTESEEDVLNVATVKDTSEFYENCLTVTEKFQKFLEKIARRIETLEIGINEFTHEEKEELYNKIENYIRNNNVIDLETLLIENIIDLNFVPEPVVNFDSSDSDSDDEDYYIDIDIPLIIKACEKGNLAIVKLLHINNANINIVSPPYYNVLGQTPLCSAIINRHNDIVKYLLENNVTVNFSMENSWNALKLAIVVDNESLLEEMITKYNADVNYTYYDESVLHYACGQLKLKAIKILLNHQANVLASGYDGSTPLHYFIRKLRNEWDETIKEVLDLYISKDFDLNAQNIYGNTVLHIAVIARTNLNVIKYLLNQGAGYDVKNAEDKTVLDIASEYDDKTIFNLLNNYKNFNNEEIIEYNTKQGQKRKFSFDEENKE